MRKNIFKAIKTTILGTVLIGTGIYIAITSTDYNVYFVGGLICSGILLWFAPDKLVNAIEKAILGKEIKLKKNDEHQ